MPQFLLAFVVAAGVMLAPRRGVADERTEQAKEHYLKGSKAYELGAFDEAVHEYTEAYRLKDDPAILYNIGQAHRLAQHPKEAVFFYKMFLTKRPDAPNRSEVEAKIAALESLIEQQKKTQNMPPDDTAKPEDTSPRETGPPSPPAPSTETEMPAVGSAPQAGRTKKIAGLVVGAVGVATLVAGIALSALAKQASDELTRANSNGLPFNHAQYNAGQTEGVAGPGLIGVGAAVVVAGAVVAALGFRDAHRARRASAASWLGANPASLGMTWSLR